MGAVVIDCTELYQNPVRTGIQRVVRELLKHWPVDKHELHVARFSEGVGLVSVSDEAVALMSDRSDMACKLPHEQLQSAIVAATEKFKAAPLPANSSVFIPEVFYDKARSQFYQDLINNANRKVALLVYDFLPYLEPNLFRLRTAAPLMHYLRLVQTVSSIGHISSQTCGNYSRRVMRNRTPSKGKVFSLGADGLSMERQAWNPKRHGFVALGSIDGRKNQQSIVAAFMQLWNEGSDVPLTLIGRAFDGVELDWLDAAKGRAHFRWLSDANDSQVINELRQARATIYVPDHEGFGLPPIESLRVGIPVIVTEAVPSLDGIANFGQVRLKTAQPDLIKQAVTLLGNDHAAEEAWNQARDFRLPTWRDFAVSTANWVSTI